MKFFTLDYTEDIFQMAIQSFNCMMPEGRMKVETFPRQYLFPAREYIKLSRYVAQYRGLGGVKLPQ